MLLNTIQNERQDIPLNLIGTMDKPVIWVDNALINIPADPGSEGGGGGGGGGVQICMTSTVHSRWMAEALILPAQVLCFCHLSIVYCRCHAYLY